MNDEKLLLARSYNGKDSANQKQERWLFFFSCHRPAWSEMDTKKRAGCFKVKKPPMSSNLISSGLCGWLVLCWFIADHAWHVSLGTQIATDINWKTLSVCQTASKIVACWSERQLPTVLYHKAPVFCDMIGHWTWELMLLLGVEAVNRRGGVSADCY